MNIQPRRRRVVIVDDHTLFRDGLRTILSMEDDFEVIADVESAEDIVELMWETKPDVLLSRAAQQKVVTFLETINASTPPLP